MRARHLVSGLIENEMVILRKTEIAMMRTKCGVKLIEKRRSQELMSLQGFKEYFGWTSQGEWSMML